MKYKYKILKIEGNIIVGVTEINTFTNKEQHWSLQGLINKRNFNNMKNNYTESFFRTQKWLQENYPEHLI